MNLLNIYRKIKATTSSQRYIEYLRNKGMSIGENTVILAPRHTYFDEGRADFITIGSGGGNLQEYFLYSPRLQLVSSS